jgi:DNA-binding winged helix-turn-helix (wHTH) protein
MCPAAAEGKLPRRFRIGDWQIDQLQGIIQKGDEIARLRPLAMRFLVCLAERAPEPVTTNELVERVWAPRIVSDDSVYVAVRELRRKLGDDARHPQYIETLPKRGVRIAAEVALNQSTMHPDTGVVASPRALPFVGREDAMASLQSHLKSALSKRGRIVFLAGEPGIGKTRAAQEFADRAEGHGASVFSSWCDESLVAPPCWPWVRLLRSMLERTTPSHVLDFVGREGYAALATILPELRTDHPEVAQPPDVSPERLSFELAQAIAALVGRIAEPQGLVLILDDVHWADEQTLGVLGTLAMEIAKARVLVLCSYRDTEVQRQHPLSAVLAGLSRLGNYDRITLAGLGRSEVSQLLSHVASDATQRVDSIIAATDGNCLFVTEIIRAIAAHEIPRDRTDPMRIPRSVR